MATSVDGMKSAKELRQLILKARPEWKDAPSLAWLCLLELWETCDIKLRHLALGSGYKMFGLSNSPSTEEIWTLRWDEIGEGDTREEAIFKAMIKVFDFDKKGGLNEHKGHT